MAKFKFTKRSVEAAEPGTHQDTDIPGFGLWVNDTGTRSFFLLYRVKGKDQKKRVIGRFGYMTVDQARTIAHGWYAQARQGIDPDKPKVKGITAADLCDRYLEQHSKPKKKPRS